MSNGVTKRAFRPASLIGASILFMASFAAQGAPVAADVLFVVDESGSMSAEHDFLDTGGSIDPGIVNDLDYALQNAGVGNGAKRNQYGLTGFGSSGRHSPANQVAHSHGSGLLSASGFGTEAQTLVNNGLTEDGYQAMDFALNNTSFRSGNIARQMVLITDEGRAINNHTNNGNTDGRLLGFSDIESALKGLDIQLNTIVDAELYDGFGNEALGVAANNDAFVENGAGSFNKKKGSGVIKRSSSTKKDYINLAHNTGGAAWDLNQLREGGTTQASFSEAFTDIKVEEIKDSNKVPTPASLLLLGTGLLALGGSRRIPNRT